MKKTISAILIFVSLLIMTSCINTTVAFGEEWDGNYIYSNGFKTKTNNLDKIYYLTEFNYNNNVVKIESYLYSRYYLNKLHLIVKDEFGMNYYLRYDPEKNEVLNIYADESKIEYCINEANLLYITYGENITYVSSNGVFPVINKTNIYISYFKDDYLIISKNGLKYAKVNSECFTEITKYKVNKYCIYNDKLYYITDTFNIYDLNTNENHTFELDINNSSVLFENGTVLVCWYNGNLSKESKNTMLSYDIINANYNFKLVVFDENYNKKEISLPLNYDFSYCYSYINGFINFLGYEYKENGIIICRNYYINDMYELEKGLYNAPQNIEYHNTNTIYNSQQCGKYKYINNCYNVNIFKGKYLKVLYGLNTETNQEYLCYKIITKEDIELPKIIVILPY